MTDENALKKATESQFDFTTSMKLSSLPRDIFNHIGSYLTPKSCLNLSMTSKNYCEMVHKIPSFNKIDKLEFSQEQLQTIYKSNSDLHWCEKCDIFRITCSHRKNIDCTHKTDDNKCILYKIVCRIQEQDESKLNWFKRALNYTKELIISNNWRCAYKHLPMEWIFDINNSNTNFNSDTNNNSNGDADDDNNEAKGSSIDGINSQFINDKDIETSKGENNGNSNRLYIRGLTGAAVSFLDGLTATAFCQNYDRYWVKKCRQMKQDDSNGEQGNIDNTSMKPSEPVIGKHVRIIGDAVIPRRFMSFATAAKFHGNYEKFRMTIPPKEGSSYPISEFRIATLQQFFKVFHPRLRILRILFRQYDIPFNYNIIHANNIQDKDKNVNYKYSEYITSCIFNRSNKRLLNDLNTTEEQLPFKTFLEKYNCQSKQLAQIKYIYFRHAHFKGTDCYESILCKKLFEHDKLMKLLNFSNTIVTLGLSFIATNNKPIFPNIETSFSGLKNNCFDLLNRLGNVNQIDFDFSMKSGLNAIDVKQLKQFFTQFLTDLIIGCLVRFDKVDTITCAIMSSFMVNHTRSVRQESSVCEVIEIGDKRQLSISNRDELIKRVKNVTQQHCDDFDKNSNKNDNPTYWILIKRNFCLS